MSTILKYILGQNKKMECTYETIVLSGGGIRGIAFLGTLQFLEDQKVLSGIHTYVGSSVGGLIAGLLSVGVSPREMMSLIMCMECKDMIDFSFGKVMSHYGFVSGDKLMGRLCQLFATKIDPQITFLQHHTQTKGKRLVLTGTCVEQQKIQYFDATNTPHIRIMDAIRLTISIPIVFTAVKLNHQHYVDGAILDNFPMSYARSLSSDSKILGLRLITPAEGLPHPIRSTEIDGWRTYLPTLIHIMMSTIDQLRNNHLPDDSLADIINIETNGIEAIDFSMSNAEKSSLFHTGWLTANRWWPTRLKDKGSKKKVD